MNKRQEQKLRTRKLILDTARKLFVSKGFLGTTTAEISGEAGIAHGTLFLHFKTKEELILAIMDQELGRINDKINQLIVDSSEFQQMLAQYLDLIIESEDFFVVLAREHPQYPDDLRRKLLFRESIIRSHFHETYTKGVVENKYQDLDAPTVLNFFFNHINYLLVNKNLFVDSGSVIARFKEPVLKTFTDLIRITRRNNEDQDLSELR
jgi:AcrR family transcriptional regulator